MPFIRYLSINVTRIYLSVFIGSDETAELIWRLIIVCELLTHWNLKEIANLTTIKTNEVLLILIYW